MLVLIKFSSFAHEFQQMMPSSLLGTWMHTKRVSIRGLGPTVVAHVTLLVLYTLGSGL